MNGLQLYLLGHKLMRIGLEALPAGSPLRGLSPAAELILTDVLQHPGTSVGEIAQRTSLPQDYVSASVFRLADGGLLETGLAPGGCQDITLNRALQLQTVGGSVDAALASVLDTHDAEQVNEVTATLESLARRVLMGPVRASAEEFNAAYGGAPLWETGRPQPAFTALTADGAIRGRVLDVGCGTGEHALMAAGLGLRALGIDVSSVAIEIARRKARERELPARFMVHDALDLGALTEQFDTVLDSGLFHNFNDEDRARYAGSLRDVIPSGGRYFMLCYSDRQPGLRPRRVKQEEIKSAFAEGWRVEAIEPVTMELINPEGARAWRAAITRI